MCANNWKVFSMKTLSKGKDFESQQLLTFSYNNERKRLWPVTEKSTSNSLARRMRGWWPSTREQGRCLQWLVPEITLIRNGKEISMLLSPADNPGLHSNQ